MGSLSKEARERRQQWADRRFQDNVEKLQQHLTEEQIELLDELRELRHWMHKESSNFSNEEWSDYGTAFDEFSNLSYTEGLCERITRAFGRKPFSRVSWYTTYDWDNVEDEERVAYVKEYNEDWGDEDDGLSDSQKWSIMCRIKVSSILEPVNTEIEEFMREIDERYDTNIAPTGYNRLWLD